MNYKYNSTVKISDHFAVSEFRCKCGKTHDTIIEPALVEKLEKLHKALNCKSIVVTSGYRCSAHDKAVGGNGSGQHTKGTAADIKCYGKDGKAISSKIVSCAAQDIGFGGIANIDKTYTATHVDVRPGKVWYGDETVTTSYSVTANFYDYYKIKKSDVYGIVQKKVTITIDDHTYSGLLTED